MVLISVDARQAEPSGLSRTRHHRESVVNILPFFEKSNFLSDLSDKSDKSDKSDNPKESKTYELHDF